jgi:hypothetical protein
MQAETTTQHAHVLACKKNVPDAQGSYAVAEAADNTLTAVHKEASRYLPPDGLTAPRSAQHCGRPSSHCSKF